eukprot:jgi/Galph1/1027/GphlegSOOS_G5824.1
MICSRCCFVPWKNFVLSDKRTRLGVTNFLDKSFACHIGSFFHQPIVRHRNLKWFVVYSSTFSDTNSTTVSRTASSSSEIVTADLYTTDKWQEGELFPEVIIDVAVYDSNEEDTWKLERRIAEQVFQNCQKYDNAFGRIYGRFNSAARYSLAASFVILGFLLGRAVSPSKRLKYTSLTGVLLSSAIVVCLYFFFDKGKKSCALWVVQLLKEKDVFAITDKEVDQICGQFGMKREEFLPYAKEIYKFYLLSCLENSQLRMTEMTALLHLKHIFRLTGEDIGDIHYDVARELYRKTLVYLDESVTFERVGSTRNSPRNILKKKELQKTEKLKYLETSEETKKLVTTLDKFFCLCDRLFSDNEPEEAYMYEWSRLRKLFSLNEEEIEKRLQSIRLPLYEKAAMASLSNHQIDVSVLENSRLALSIEREGANRVHSQVYRSKLESLLNKRNEITLDEKKDLERIEKALSIDRKTADELLLSVTVPVIQRTVEQLLVNTVRKQSTTNLESYTSTDIQLDVIPLVKKVQETSQKLMLSKDALVMGLKQGISSATASLLKKTMNFVRVQNFKAAGNEAKLLLSLYQVAGEMVDKLQVVEQESDAFHFTQEAMAKTAFSYHIEERRLLYRIFLNDCLKQLPLDEGKKAALRNVRMMLSLSELDAEDAYRRSVGPVYKKKLESLIESRSSFSEEDKLNIKHLEESLSLSTDTAKEVKLVYYKSRLAKLLENNRIYSSKEAEELVSLQTFFGLSDEEVIPYHIELATPVYDQSVREAMGSTGIIPSEYHDALDQLRKRLNLPENEANQILYNITKVTMKAYVDRAIKIIQQRSAPRGANETRDIGDDPLIQKPGTALGIEAGGNVAMELSNLVEYCTRNRLIRERTVVIQKEGNTESSEEPETRTVLEFPVTLRSLFDPAVLQELYRQYLIQCFAVKTRSEKQRYFRDLDRLAGVFGLTNEEVNKVHSNLGTVIYNQYLSQALSEGRLEQKDLEFLQNIQQSLSMSPELCLNLIKDAKKSKVSSLLQNLLGSANVTPDQMRELRETCNRLQVSLVDDLSSSKEQRKRLFTLEVDTAIENGIITVQNQKLIGEIQESYSIDDDEARKLLVECIQNRCNSHLVQAAAYLRQNRPQETIQELNILLKFGCFIPDEVRSPVITEKEKEELLLLYQASTIGEGEDSLESQDALDLLKTIFGFAKTNDI